jgi:hypothetical protein
MQKFITYRCCTDWALFQVIRWAIYVLNHYLFQ